MIGLDYSIWRPPSPLWLSEQGYGFVCRYLDFTPNPKVIDAAELRGYWQAGIEVVLIWENGAYDMRLGAAAGVTAGYRALQEATALEVFPCPIYFAADFDATESDQSEIDAYLLAAGNMLGDQQLVGIYGGYWAVSRALDHRTARYGWQTTAWSGGLWDDRAQLRQFPNPSPDYDTDQSMTVDFGQVPGRVPVPGPGPGPAGQSWGDETGGRDGWPPVR